MASVGVSSAVKTIQVNQSGSNKLICDYVFSSGKIISYRQPQPSFIAPKILKGMANFSAKISTQNTTGV